MQPIQTAKKNHVKLVFLGYKTLYLDNATLNLLLWWRLRERMVQNYLVEEQNFDLGLEMDLRIFTDFSLNQRLGSHSKPHSDAVQHKLKTYLENTTTAQCSLVL